MNHRGTVTVLGLTAAAVVLSTGGAVAGSMITGAQIKDGTVASKDIKNRSLVAADLTRATADGFSKPGPRGAPGLVRGYGAVSSVGVLSRQSGGITISNPMTGVFCLTVPGVDPASSVAVVSPDFTNNLTSNGPNGSQSVVEVAVGANACPAGAFQVVTMVRSFDAGADGVTSTVLPLADQPFTFLVP